MDTQWKEQLVPLIAEDFAAAAMHVHFNLLVFGLTYVWAEAFLLGLHQVAQ